jgi:dipeptidyl-peptidase-4
MTLMLMAKAPDIFRAGISVAPVTDWKLYDTHYTERYLGHPDENASGYDQSSAFPYLDRISGKLLLIHGMADDNVLFTNTTRLMKVLQDNNIQFELMAYPGAKHGISGRTNNIHRYTMMTGFLQRHLGGVS